jgi:3-dehydroquinate dehydratase/shikimate dehydrogenase
MICISIAEVSRRFALADMLNAGPQCDLLEVRLDRFDHDANISELLAARRKPVIMTCRRGEDGGDWSGHEEERLTLLRQCVASKADYVEIELDVADQIRPLPPSKRVIAYTNILETPANLPEIYREALTKSPDVVKLVIPSRTPEEVWPAVQILARPAVPTVVVGLGQPGIMLALLARKMGAPWTYAALERGMEAYYGQATVADLENVYHYRSIGRDTPLVGVTGFGEQSYLNVALLNTALASLGVPTRCLPLEIGDLRLFRQVLDAVQLGSVVIDAAHQSRIREIVADLKPSAQVAAATDFITREEGKWRGYNLFSRAAWAALDETLRVKRPGEKPLQGRVVMFVGVNGLAHVLAVQVQHGGGIPILADRDREAAHSLAQTLGCRFVLPEAVYSTLHDVLVRCDDTELHTNYLRPGMTVLDLTALPRPSALLADAEQRGCHVVSPRQVLVELVARQVRAIAGQDVARAPLLEALRAMFEN